MRKKTDTTREMYLKKALLLFAEKGFESVTVAQISTALGLTPPALYKHFKSKQDLFDAILEESNRSFNMAMENLRANAEKLKEAGILPTVPTEEEQIEDEKKAFLFALHNESASAFRRLMIVEQFHMPQLANLYTERYVEVQYRRHAAMFAAWMEMGIIQKGDPYLMAVGFVSPVIVFIGVCDRDSSKEEWALQMIEQHVKEFNRLYRIK